MEHQQLTGFLAVARLGSFTKAAKDTYRTQPAISLQIRALENELKVKLFSRVGRTVRLTEEGEHLLSIVSPLLSNIASIPSRLSELRGETLGGTLTIVTHASVMSYILPNVLRALKEKYPLLKFNVLDRSREGILSLLGKGEADVGVSSFPSNLTKDFYYEAISRHSRVLLLPKKHPLSGKKKLSLSNLKDIPLILSPEGSRTRQAVTDAFLRFQIEPNISIEVSDREAMKKYTALGFGVSVLSDYYIVSEDKKHFHVRDMSSVFGWSDRGVITLKNRYLSAPAKEFIDLLKKEFKKNKTRVSSV